MEGERMEGMKRMGEKGIGEKGGWRGRRGWGGVLIGR